MTIHEFLVHGCEMLAGREQGPLTFRLVAQPTVAIIPGIRAGLRDVRESRPPYLLSALTNRGVRSRRRYKRR